MLKRYLVLGILLGVAGSAIAADTSGLQALDRVLNSLFDISSGVASKSPLLDDGTRLYGYLLLILISWSGILVVLEGGALNAVIAKLVEVIMVAGICSFLMMANTQQALVKTFDVAAGKLATTVNSTAPDLSNPAAAIKQILGTGFRAVQDLWDSKTETKDKQPWYQFDMQNGVADLVIGLIMESIAKMGISMVVLICLGLYVYIVINAMLLINVALILAPIMLPWMLWPSTAFLAQGWLRFLIVCGMNKLVAAMLLGFTFYFLDAIGAYAQEAATSPIFNTFAYFTALTLAVIMTFAMLQVPRVAADIISGTPALALHLPKPTPPSPRRDSPRPPSPSSPPPGGGGGAGRPPPATPRPQGPSGGSPSTPTRSTPRVNLLK
ncbi:type IV secretion system protein [Dechloromonas sp. ARDL1]|uniref:type IV secretion system protein n=1 Tax=Dechloromonas sp. ARDL1 TaxID=3322121 RepID=UPI003DA78916